MNAAETDDETLRERTVCALCGRRAVEGAVFEVTASETGRYAICPECRYTGGQQQASGFLIPVMIVGVLFLLGTALDRGPNGGRVLANLFVGWVIMLLTTLPHEFAHALTARWLGLGTGRVHAGFGPLMLHGKFLGFPFLWRAIPLGGLLELGKPERPVTLPRLFLVYAAGPASHVVMAAAAWLLMGRPGLSGFDPMTRIEFGWLFIGANLWQFVANMRPVWRMEYGQVIVSDGLSMAQILFLRRRPFLPQWRPGSRWSRLFPVAFIGAVVLLTLAVKNFKDGGGATLAPWLYVAGFYVCYSMARSMDLARIRRPEDSKRENLGGSIHRQLNVAVEAQIAREAERLKEDGWQAIETVSGDGDEEALLKGLEQRAAEHEDSYLPHLLLGGEHLRRENWPAAEIAYKECLHKKLPFVIHAAAFHGWMWAAMSAGSLNAIAVRLRMGHFRSQHPPPLPLCCVLDAAASLVLESGCTVLLTDAEKWTEETMSLAAGEITVAGTRGGILIETGQLAEGEALLRHVVARSACENDQGISWLYLAIAAKRRGDEKEAAILANRAGALLPAASLFRRRLQGEFLG